MPHAENTMGENSMNGETVHSHFLEHLASYPVVSDSITVIKTNKYGAKYLQYADQGYVNIAKPVLPYFSKPYGYVAPYVARADSIGDKGLTKVDETFPFIQQDTDTLKGTIRDGIFLPVRFAADLKDHVLGTYGSEYKECGGDGVVASGKALITTGFILSQESLEYLSSLLRAKKAQAKEPPEPEPESSSDDGAPPATQVQRRRLTQNAPSSDSDDDDDDHSEAEDTRAPTSLDVMVKKMVRLALASEYARQPIRRTDISAKVLGEQGARQFKTVFEDAQRVLRVKFGMEMTELPVKEKVTITQRRAAQKVEKPSSSNKSWILSSILPPEYRKPEILPPTKAPLEGTYTGLYSFIIAVILLNGGAIQEQKLDRYLKRTNAETYTPIDRTDRFLQRLCREGYLVRNREVDGGEEVIEYILGPRGKIEVGAQGVAGLVREVYGRSGDGERDQELEIRLARSLGFELPEQTAGGQEGEGQGQGGDGDGDGDEDGEQRQGRRQRQRREQPTRRTGE
ncbi:MAGE-domain-containing protein [Aspergillus heteromorphus CBS 117.55]|uniref:MAGE-domain-containing protein n=1 Tax=Aspergillus heteromorphus CBS 117.55 TaxID=1448321 RepID=A0A317VPN0_9EURO|nr:MAGE-domain-containing protein [Aspergillus heteromorphus CBS 117.55]PWY76306.1 MAGE-domain-containing protein [Aspergillus heteromorphus CBS 117.55]